ncbi:feruloyl-CoA synthase [Variovorax sp. N23]|uniref:feruloyl-CoA synthase n=1 Tax=Variovorax sp. N23 TaxID=2980555 RepID=UPI0021C8A97A|nr:feruloyl-CoA synthase [Variovorax sp. N23]MCU4121699.1 feruloyl-CoA synthase [Variovorax sp. N23]
MSAMAIYDDPARVAPARIACRRHADGSLVLRSTEPLGDYARCIGEWIERWSGETPDALALAERDAAGGWRRMTWGQLRVAIGAIAQRLIDLGLPRERPIVILSDNSIDHALLMLGAMHVGLPVCPVSSAYSRLSRDHAKIRGIVDALHPSLIYAADAKVYGAAMAACAGDAIQVLGDGAEHMPGALDFARFLETRETPAVMAVFETLSGDDVAKYLLTSGSTGQPKVVPNTHRMLCANQQALAQTWRFLETEKPVIVDWLPWSHTFGGNHNLHMVLRHGGALYIDEGRPAPGLIEKTVRNLREVRPNLHFNVPRGLDMLLPLLEADLDLARDVLSRLQLVFYAAAALPAATWGRLEALAAQVREEPLWLTTSWGATETAPLVTSAHFRLDGAGCIGVPLPGTELKLVRNGEKLEMRVRGVSVFAGYRDAPALTAAAFDDEGFYRIGDAGLVVDPGDPSRGVLFDGRVSEDFKLSTGTWVSVGPLRLKLVSALSPYAADVVLTGHDRDEIGALVFPSPAASQASADEVAQRVREALSMFEQSGVGSSQMPRRVMFLTDPPDADAGEITDKGYVNQRAVLTRRADEVARMHAEAPDTRVIRVARPAPATASGRAGRDA